MVGSSAVAWTNHGLSEPDIHRAFCSPKDRVGSPLFLMASSTIWLVGGLSKLVLSGISLGVVVLLVPPLLAYIVFYLLPMVAEKRRARWALRAVEKRLRQ